ncbi:MAG TPA: SpoIIE family protein phosphatase [Polyangiaceae bacterium]|nr:SpoIIE family protein phosphatase [Polyangiaceae bacterium]
MNKSSEVPSSDRASRSEWEAYLEITLDGNLVSHHVLSDPHVLVGRTPTSQVFLDHPSVSRYHAELVCDPFGRWWVRDLGSTNGTSVNGVLVSERVLNPGDVVGVADYTLRVHLPGSSVPARGVVTGGGSVSSGNTFDDLELARVEALGSISRQAARARQISVAHLSTVVATSRRFLATESRDERLASLCSLMVGADFPADVACIFRVNAADLQPTMLCPPHFRDPARTGQAPYVSQSVIRAILQGREPVLASNVKAPDVGVELTLSSAVRKLAVIACPLASSDDRLDVFYVKLPAKYGTVEWLILVTLVAEVYQQAESTWAARQHARAQAAVERELDMARQIQQGLVPHSPNFERIEVALGFNPCKWVGGDYVDAVPMLDGRALFVLADVCGKGMQAALVTSSLHTMVHLVVDSGGSLSRLVHRLNRHLCSYLPEHSFVTMVCVALDPETGAYECVNAGHPPPFLIGPDGRLRHMQSAVNPPLGLAPFAFEVQSGTLEPGEMMALYSDGLTELRNEARQMLGGEQLGAGLARVYVSMAGAPIDEIGAKLTAMLDNYRGRKLAEDDSTFLLARRKGFALRASYTDLLGLPPLEGGGPLTTRP